jgi:hypothetical protein
MRPPKKNTDRVDELTTEQIETIKALYFNREYSLSDIRRVTQNLGKYNASEVAIRRLAARLGYPKRQKSIFRSGGAQIKSNRFGITS